MEAALSTVATTVPKVSRKRANPSVELSIMLKDLADNAGERVSVKQICDALGDRSFGAFLLVFCLPNLAPMPPGSSMILGIPMIIIAFQIFAGHSKVWLPARIADYSLSRETFQNMINKIAPYLERGEKMVKERYWPLNHLIGDRIFGLFALILAIVVTIPIPLGNWPPAFAIAFLAAAYTKKDGIFLAFGTLVGIGSLFLAGSVVMAGIFVILHIT